MVWLPEPMPEGWEFWLWVGGLVRWQGFLEGANFAPGGRFSGRMGRFSRKVTRSTGRGVNHPVPPGGLR